MYNIFTPLPIRTVAALLIVIMYCSSLSRLSKSSIAKQNLSRHVNVVCDGLLPHIDIVIDDDLLSGNEQIQPAIAVLPVPWKEATQRLFSLLSWAPRMMTHGSACWMTLRLSLGSDHRQRKYF